MHSILERNLFVIKEHVGIFKAANNYDVLDPETGEIIMHCREPNLGMLTKLLRFTDFKRMTPFDVRITTPEGEPVVQISRGVSLFLSRVNVTSDEGQAIGGFKQKLFTIGGKFDVLDANDQTQCQLRGKWTSWSFQFVAGDRVLAKVDKKWAGLGKELFTTADTYVLSIEDSVPKDAPVRMLILAAVMCIDMVLKE